MLNRHCELTLPRLTAAFIATSSAYFNTPVSVAAGLHTSYITGCSFSPDGLTLCLASEDSTASLIDMTTGKRLRRLKGLHDAPLTACGPFRTFLHVEAHASC